MKRFCFFIFTINLILFSCDKPNTTVAKNRKTLKYKNNESFSGNDIIEITLWHCYDGIQKEKFDSLTEEFNQTEGTKYGIKVNSIRRAGTSYEIAAYLTDAIARKIGADEIPNVFSAYPDTVFKFDKKGIIANLSDYLPDEKHQEYLDDFLHASTLDDDSGGIKIFPIAKTTESFFLNKTAWQPFAQACGLSYSDLSTWEKITKTAELYYNWTDSLTRTPHDGKSFFGRDCLENYILIGIYELTENSFSATADNSAELKEKKEALKICWNNYYIPFVKGHFSAIGKLRSDDLRTGEIIACVSPSEHSVNLPADVIDNLGAAKPVDFDILPLPNFENALAKTAIQRGAGMSVIKSSPKKEIASLIFLDWFTCDKRNIEFSFATGYLPVKKEALKTENIENFIQSSENNIKDHIKKSIITGIETLNSHQLYFQSDVKKIDNIRKFASLLNNKAVTDREKFKELIASGKPYQQVLEMFFSEDSFEKWFSEITKESTNKINR